MRRKIGMILGLLFLWSTMTVYAAPSDNRVAEAVSGYCLDHDLHAFVWLKDDDGVSNLSVDIQSSSVSADRRGTIQQIKRTGANVRYMFMVDRTGSMQKYAKEINAFVGALMDKEEMEPLYTVATFGEQFQVVASDMTDKNAVKTVLQKLDYKEQRTNPYSGVESALTYLDNNSIESGDLIHLVVITDGQSDLERNLKNNEGELSQNLKERISGTPEILVSTLCTEKWTETAYQALSAGKGLHETVSSEQAAAAAGERLAEYVDGLYRVSISLAGEPTERFSVKMQLSGQALFNLSLDNVPNLKRLSHELPEEPENRTESLGESENQAESPEGPQNQAELPEDPQNRAESPEEPQNRTESPEDPQNRTELPEPKASGNCLLPSILGGVFFLAAIGVILFSRRRKSPRSRKRPKPEQVKGTGTGFAMKLEVYSGSCKGSTAKFYLAKPLVIGSAPGCGLVFEDPGVSPRNSRIFIRDQKIYIEDLNSANGTALGGMRIQGQNRLRSGDVISIGNVEFCFKF